MYSIWTISFAFHLNTIVYFITTVKLSLVAGSDEGSSEYGTVNKPMIRSPKPWRFSRDYVRCFCNLPSCVTTGYMCKSSSGGCFSDILDQSTSIYRGRHGCLEFLSKRDQKSRCQLRERTTIRRKENPKSILLCCSHDMCNHVEGSPMKYVTNSTSLDELTEDVNNRYQHKQETILYSNSEVWFRAATIAVPICGAVILFVLIALAVKILKTEHQNSVVRKLGPAMYHVHAMPQERKIAKDRYQETYDDLVRKEFVITNHQNLFNPDMCVSSKEIHVPLLDQNSTIPNSGMEKNETNARLNLMNCDVGSGKSIILEIEKEPPECAAVNIVNSNTKYTDNVKFFVDKSSMS